ncbi:hypothetical protein LTS18_011579 [Coniosporium uncinatum]|uniref:Uncharacterized protein n=1 Tax=Coniosporium uncinatum TaxID=93489 RepID=A0ACC3DJZ9_9PEZI|nr:hypothetical protein LTS18_011579 [Coniosporium uncinatum]
MQYNPHREQATGSPSRPSGKAAESDCCSSESSPSATPSSRASGSSKVPAAPVAASSCPVPDRALPEQVPFNFNFSGTVRTYYMTSEVLDWDYAPTGWDNWLGVPIASSPRAAPYAHQGTKFQKARYVGYTDSTFTKKVDEVPTAGINGPIIRAEVGDMIQVVFLNLVPDHPTSVHSMGLTYTQYSEGSNYPNTTDGTTPPFAITESVPPGECVVYKWLVAENDGPPANEPSILRSYHPFVNLEADMNSGLVGPNIIYGRGLMNNTVAAYREFIVLYEIFEEANSWVGNSGSQLVEPHDGNSSFWQNQLMNIPEGSMSAPNFWGGASGQPGPVVPYFTINGFIFSGGPAFEMCEKDHVIWYAMSYGSAPHVFHLHGNNVWTNGLWVVAKAINPGEGFNLYMRPAIQGVWQVICHLANHLSMGMQANYRVWPEHSCPLPPLAEADASPIN